MKYHVSTVIQARCRVNIYICVYKITVFPRKLLYADIISVRSFAVQTFCYCYFSALWFTTIYFTLYYSLSLNCKASLHWQTVIYSYKMLIMKLLSEVAKSRNIWPSAIALALLHISWRSMAHCMTWRHWAEWSGNSGGNSVRVVSMLVVRAVHDLYIETFKKWESFS